MLWNRNVGQNSKPSEGPSWDDAAERTYLPPLCPELGRRHKRVEHVVDSRILASRGFRGRVFWFSFPAPAEKTNISDLIPKFLFGPESDDHRQVENEIVLRSPKRCMGQPSLVRQVDLFIFYNLTVKETFRSFSAEYVLCLLLRN